MYLCVFFLPTDNVSLNMDGLLTVTNQNQNVVSVLCRVTHNISNISLLTSFFYLNDTELDRTSDLERDGSVNTFVVHDRCYMPPFQSHCEELTLVLRTISQINNTRITCKSRARVDTMSQLDSREVITVIVEDPGMGGREAIEFVMWCFQSDLCMCMF